MAMASETDVDWSLYNGLFENDESIDSPMTLDEVGFEQITRCETEIAHLKERLRSGKARRAKKLRAQIKLEELETRLAELQKGHDKVARKLQIRARTLEALPREMRDAIFEKLYFRETPIEATWTRFGDRIHFNMPKDTALYLSQLHVGPVIASEAAEIFYKQNVFQFDNMYSPWTWRGRERSAWDDKKYDLWLNTDHYGSGFIPQPLVRRVALELPYSNVYGFDPSRFNGAQTIYVVSHAVFEEAYVRGKQIQTTPNYFDHRDQLQYFLKLDGLHELQVLAHADLDQRDKLLRLINPFIRQLKATGIKVTVNVVYSEWDVEPENKDITSSFDEPSETDFAKYYALTNRPPVFKYDEHDDPLNAWWRWSKEVDKDFGVAPADTLEYRRVWLFEHYEVYKYYQKNRRLADEFSAMKVEMEWLAGEALATRRKYYGRLLELVTAHKSMDQN